MKLQRRNRIASEVYSHSLNDIMFFLLLFFLIAATMATPNVLKLLLPNSKTSAQQVKHPVTIAISGDMQYAVNNQVIPVEQLESTIANAIAGQIDPTAILKVDKSVQVQNLVDILDIGNKLKIKMVLATNSAKE